MKACANLLSDDDEMRLVVIEKVFQQCCTDGQVGEMVLAHLPEDLYKKLLSEVQVSGTTILVADLPPEWRCNIRKEERWGRKPPFCKTARSFQQVEEKHQKLNWPNIFWFLYVVTILEKVDQFHSTSSNLHNFEETETVPSSPAYRNVGGVGPLLVQLNYQR